MNNFELLKMVIALMVLINPLGAIPIFISLTPGATQEERKKIAKTSFSSSDENCPSGESAIIEM